MTWRLVSGGFRAPGFQFRNRLGGQPTLIRAFGVKLDHGQGAMSGDRRDLFDAAPGFGQVRGGQFP